MDIAYAVKQLDLEIGNDQRRLAEKTQQRNKLWSVLTPQEQALFRAPAPTPAPAPAAEPAAAAESKSKINSKK